MAGKQDRQRKLARERYQRRIAREADRQARARRMTQVTAGGVVVLVIIAVVVVGIIALTHSSKSSATAISSPSASPAATTPAPSPSATPSATPSSATVKEPATHCTYTQQTSASKQINGLPPSTPDFKATYQATINTNRGAIVIDLLNSKATCTVNSFVFLAQQKFFSSTTCHRLTTKGIFVLQCGDPTGTGSGGPGYEFGDENLAGATYPAATVAMANAGPNTNGSQFFLVYKNTPLPPSYTPFGTIVSGLNIIQQVAKAGSDNSNGAGDGHPKEKVEIESVTIKKT